jgi:hypothetical protein
MFGGTIAGLYYVWHQVTKLPDWYRESAAPPSPASIQQTTAAVEKRIQQAQEAQVQPSAEPQLSASQSPVAVSPAPSPRVEVQVDQAELNDLLAAKITTPAPTNPLSQSVKGLHTEVENETLKTGAIVDIKQLKSSNLGSSDQELVSKITQQLPALADQKVYVGIAGKPKVKDGQLQFDDDTRIQVGNLSMTVKEVSDRFGIPPEQVREKLKLQLKLQGLDVKDIQLQDGKATLRGAAKP